MPTTVLARLAFGVICAVGCSAPASAGAPQPASAAPGLTFTKDIAPLVFEHCASCHRPGGSAPFSLLTYLDVRARAREISLAVARRSMPPWKPEPGYGDFEGTRRLSDDQVARIVRWAQEGSLEGSPADLHPPRWSDEWRLGKPDLIVRIGAPYKLPPGGPDRMRNFVVPIPLTAGRYVKAWEFRTTAPQVVHHATMVLDPSRASRRLDEESPEPGYEGLIPLSAQNPDGYFLGWTPGQSPSVSPDDMAWRIDAGSDLVLMLHMTPSGQWESVDASLALYFHDRAPSRVPAMVRLNRQDQDIPAGESQYIARDTFTLPVDVDAYSIQPHAHNLARHVRAFATRPDGSTQALLYISDWDFHWQDAYRYRQPVFLPAGTQLNMEVVYDNSPGNRANPSFPPRRVTYGQRTTDEMGDVWIQVVPRSRSDLSTLVTSLRRKLLPQNIQGYRMMLQSDPENVGLHDDLALLSVEAGDLASALSEFSESLRLRPEVPAAHYNVGNALLLLQRFDEAQTHFRAAIARNPDYTLAHQGLALVHYNVGVVRQRQKQFEAALAEYREALRIAPELAEAHFGSGAVQASLGHGALAVESFRRALTIRPEWPAAQLELAWVLATSGEDSVWNPAEAAALAARIRPVGNEQAHTLDVLAAVHAAAGRFDEAVTLARKARLLLTTGEDAGLAAQIEERLAVYLARRAYRTPAVGVR